MKRFFFFFCLGSLLFYTTAQGTDESHSLTHLTAALHNETLSSQDLLQTFSQIIPQAPTLLISEVEGEGSLLHVAASRYKYPVLSYLLQQLTTEQRTILEQHYQDAFDPVWSLISHSPQTEEQKNARQETLKTLLQFQLANPLQLTNTENETLSEHETLFEYCAGRNEVDLLSLFLSHQSIHPFYIKKAFSTAVKKGACDVTLLLFSYPIIQNLSSEEIHELCAALLKPSLIFFDREIREEKTKEYTTIIELLATHPHMTQSCINMTFLQACIKGTFSLVKGLISRVDHHTLLLGFESARNQGEEKITSLLLPYTNSTLEQIKKYFIDAAERDKTEIIAQLRTFISSQVEEEEYTQLLRSAASICATKGNIASLTELFKEPFFATNQDILTHLYTRAKKAAFDNFQRKKQRLYEQYTLVQSFLSTYQPPDIFLSLPCSEEIQIPCEE